MLGRKEGMEMKRGQGLQEGVRQGQVLPAGSGEGPGPRDAAGPKAFLEL